MRDDDASYIRITPAVFISVVVGVSGVSTGIAAYFKTSPDSNELATVKADVRSGEKRLAALESQVQAAWDTARAAQGATSHNAQSINDNRKYIWERTADRRTGAAAAEDWQKQRSRDEQQDRRLDGVERDMDKLTGQ